MSVGGATALPSSPARQARGVGTRGASQSREGGDHGVPVRKVVSAVALHLRHVKYLVLFREAAEKGEREGEGERGGGGRKREL